IIAAKEVAREQSGNHRFHAKAREMTATCRRERPDAADLNRDAGKFAKPQGACFPPTLTTTRKQCIRVSCFYVKKHHSQCGRPIDCSGAAAGAAGKENSQRSLSRMA